MDKENTSSAIAVTPEKNMIEIIAKAASNPDVDIDKMERLLDFQIKMMDRQAKIDYDNALTRIQAKMPRIKKKGQIKNKHDKVVSEYMIYEDIDRQIRPLLREEGFSLTHSRTEQSGKMIIATTLRHKTGHQETVSIPLPYDSTNAQKNAVQATVSTASYGRRVNVCGLLDIIGEGEDDDGQASSYTKIHPDTAEAIKASLAETDSDVEKFLDYMGADCINNILSKDLEKANLALGRKIKNTKPLFNT